MGMSRSAASTTALRAKRNDRPTTYMRKFLQAAIRDHINEYSMQSFAKFGLDIEVSPVLHAKRMKLFVEHFGEVTVGYHTYIFSPKHNSQPSKALSVRLHHGGVQVRFCGSWRPISAYLDEISTEWTYPATRQVELNRQRYWWDSNGKTFEITKLPGEIRNAIFDFAFPSEALPFHVSECEKRSRLVPNFGRSYTALMRTNKQLSQEASNWFYNTTTFTVDHYHLFSKTLGSKNLRDRNHFLRDRLRHLRLALDHSEYLDLFTPKPWKVSAKPYVKYQLREMSDLKSLEIHFRAPSRIATKTWLEGACQKTAINMIIDAAWPSIRGLPVTVTGYVKDSQKREIEDRVQSERDAYALFEAQCRKIGKHCSLLVYDRWVNGEIAEEKEQGGVRLDGEPWAAVEAGESGALQWNCMSNQDLREIMWCTCEKRCSLDMWDSED
jgi:hypothetical protein